MADLFREILKFILIFLILFHLYPEYRYWTNFYQLDVAGNEIYEVINKSKKKIKKKKLILGDSVAKQFSETNLDTTKFLNLASNQAISLVGQFCILSNFLQAKNKIDTLYFLYHPFSFSNNLNNSFTFHYFIKPFYRNEYLNLFTPEVNTQIEKIPFYFLAKYHPVLTSNWSPNVDNSLLNEPYFSKISKIYLERIKLICQKQNIHLIIIPTPINEKFKIEILKIKKSNSETLLKSYFEKVKFYPESYFLADHVHLNDMGKKYFSFENLL